MLQAANAIAEEPHIPVNKYQLLEQEDALMRRFKKSWQGQWRNLQESILEQVKHISLDRGITSC